jgi:hypothetical protein
MQTATVDNIRNWAHGIGGDNPLFCDPDVARSTRWGGDGQPSRTIAPVPTAS